MINRILRHPKVQNSKIVEYGFRTLIVGGICAVVVMVFGDMGKALTTDKRTAAIKDCTGDYNTIPCHQLKIEQLLLESRKKHEVGQ